MQAISFLFYHLFQPTQTPRHPLKPIMEATQALSARAAHVLDYPTVLAPYSDTCDLTAAANSCSRLGKPLLLVSLQASHDQALVFFIALLLVIVVKS